MSFNFRLPNITATDEKGQLMQIKSYLFQLVQDLNFVINEIESKAADSVSNKED